MFVVDVAVAGSGGGMTGAVWPPGSGRQITQTKNPTRARQSKAYRREEKSREGEFRLDFRALDRDRKCTRAG